MVIEMCVATRVEQQQLKECLSLRHQISRRCQVHYYVKDESCSQLSTSRLETSSSEHHVAAGHTSIQLRMIRRKQSLKDYRVNSTPKISRCY